MAEIKATFTTISDFKIGAKVVLDKETEMGVVMTHVSFDVDSPPGRFNDILLALASNHAINVTFESPQSKLDIQ